MNRHEQTKSFQDNPFLLVDELINLETKDIVDKRFCNNNNNKNLEIKSLGKKLQLILRRTTYLLQ